MISVTDGSGTGDMVVVRLGASYHGKAIGSVARTVLPSTPTISSYTMVGTREGTDDTVNESFTSLTDAELTLSAGVWDFTLTTLAEGNGTVSVLLRWPAGITCTVDSATAAFLGGDSTSLDICDITVDSVPFKRVAFAQDVPADGSRILMFRLKDAKSKVLASVSESVRILNNLTSAATITLAESDFNTPPSAPSGLSASKVPNILDSAKGKVKLAWTDTPSNETGFALSSNGTGTTYTAGQTFTMGSASVTLYAQWTTANPTITYYPNGSAGGSVPAVTSHSKGLAHFVGKANAVNTTTGTKSSTAKATNLKARAMRCF